MAIVTTGSVWSVVEPGSAHLMLRRSHIEKVQTTPPPLCPLTFLENSFHNKRNIGGRTAIHLLVKTQGSRIVLALKETSDV